MTTELATEIPQTPAAPADVLPPTPDEIDAAILFYKNAKACFTAAKKSMDAEAAKMVFLVDSFGTQPAKAEQSMRLAGRRNTVTVTRGTTITVNRSEEHTSELQSL